MIGLVIVSHSATLARGVKELADQIAQGKVKIAIAGGMVDDANLLGTDPSMIKQAIKSVYSKDGVLVLVDIGSAVMNAQIAIEQLSEKQQQNVLLCEAPLVEGAIAATAQGMAGADLQTAAAEATNALGAKHALIRRSIPEPQINAIPADADTLSIKVPNRLGLHARPAARLIGVISQYDGQVWVRLAEGPFVSAKSISQVSTLGAAYGDELTFRIRSVESSALQQAILDFASDNFGDQLDGLKEASIAQQVEKGSGNHTMFTGVPAAEGIAISKAIVYETIDPIIEKQNVGDVDEEVRLLQNTIEITINEIKQIQTNLDKATREIFNFHLLLLNDIDFVSKVISRIKKQKINAAYVWQLEVKKLKASYAGMDSEYMRERAADISELGNKVLYKLIGDDGKDVIIREPGILIIDEIGPAAVATMDLSMVEGILMRRGGKTSHAAIMARSAGIPAIVGLGSKLDYISDGEMIAIDGELGVIWRADYHNDKIDDLLKKQSDKESAMAALLKDASLPAMTLDGKKYPIMANVKNAADAQLALENGADGIGLFRTEYLFMNRDLPPTEEEQYQAYLSVCQAIEGLPVTIRTLDVGGDKPIPYLDIDPERNPYLGLRAIRYCLHDIPLFKTQLKAICRVSADYNVRLMYPMIAVPDELIRANEILKEVQAELTAAEIPYDQDMEVGIMIEVPSTIFSIPELAVHCDFFSIGTNDLTQYLLAMDRGNPAVATYRSAKSQSVQSAIAAIIKKSLAENIEIAMCGELAGDASMTETLIHYGLEEFSMSPKSIPAVKDKIRKLHYSNKQINDGSDEQWMIQHLLRETGM